MLNIGSGDPVSQPQCKHPPTAILPRASPTEGKIYISINTGDMWRGSGSAVEYRTLDREKPGHESPTYNGATDGDSW